MAGWSLSALPSHASGPGADFGAANRLDPFYDGVWKVGSSASWMSLADWQRSTTSGLIRPTKAVRVDIDGARLRLSQGKNWERTLRVLGVLGSYRTVTAEQLALASGVEQVASGSSSIMSDLFSLGLVDIGEYARPFAASNASASRRRSTLYRPSRTRAFDAVIAPRCTYEEWVSVTGGDGFDTSGQYDWHNILVSELVLRSLEFLPQLAGALGERHSSAAKLAYESVGAPAPTAAHRRSADATLFRNDGLRIAVELTASTGKSFASKVDRWTSTLAERRYVDTGLVVLYVIAPNSGVQGSTSVKSVRRAVTGALRRSAGATRGLPSDPTSNRMFVVDWEDWFPAAREVSRDFLSLTVRRMADNDEWVPASLLDANIFPTPGNPMLRDGLRNLAGLRQTPAWVQSRLGTPPELWRVASGRSTVRTGEHVYDPANPQPNLPAIPERMMPVGDRGVSYKSGPKTSDQQRIA